MMIDRADATKLSRIAARTLILGGLLGLLLGSCASSHGSTDAGPRDGEADAGSDARSDTGSDAGGPGCVHSTDCRLAPASCCGACGAYTRDDIVSMTPDALEAYRASACAGGIGCPACYQAPDPALLPVCEAGSCGVLDLYDPAMDHRSAFTACETDSECMLRVAACCECGATIDGSTVVAIRVDQLAAFEALLCPPGTGCPECAPLYPDYLFTHCRADTAGGPKRCVVDVIGP